MNVYVESNFVLEIALRQGQAESCREILAHCSQGRARLVLPAFSIAEPFYALGGRAKRHLQAAESLRIELGEMSRSEALAEEAVALQAVAAVLARLVEEERAGLRGAMQEVLDAAELIPLDAAVIREADRLEQSLGLSPQDAVVLASVLAHLEAKRPGPCCFLNRNARDFDDPDVVARLDGFGCRVLPNFAEGLRSIRGAL